MGITRDSRHKRSATGAKRAQYRKKRKFELGRQAANTRIGPKRIHEVRVRGGNKKYRALRLDSGNFSWGSEGVSKKTRVIQVSYHPSNNELVRTNTLTKSAVVQIDAAPFRVWYETHYGVVMGSKGKKPTATPTPKSKHVQRKLNERAPQSKIDSALESQFAAGRLYAVISSRPGQSGRCDGYILEGEELAFYLRRMSAKK
ncbi:40S ribosomal protein S8 [Schizosaccharomyces japonicus yFS275]|uniref:40S ribosomal protein S8 n=1 Tax=Schizosaccharomyces japonicus (strain yFS275 / FY16936) TaxID=402676 RepID=B6K5Q4_SCHJY|nr:40S ribosomal protein S8 [Schizosaccharomyces japonicus yFS275]EEB08858.1 40S ribosomal protein S8 [Schizosaccharomyces japonicus yFS275]